MTDTMNSKYYLTKARALPAKVIIKKLFIKIKSKALNTISKICANVFGTEITDEEFLKEILYSGYEFKDLEDLQKYFQKAKEPKFFIGASSKKYGIVKIVQDNFPETFKQVTKDADRICDHVFDLLGSEPTKLKVQSSRINRKNDYEPIAWHFDFQNEYQWNSRKYHKGIEIPYGKADIKIPWELSRFQHLTTLGQAYWFTGKEEHAYEFVNQVSDWIESNPPKFGVNWACTMDVAIRASNWLVGWEFFRGSTAVRNDNFEKVLFKSIFTHGKFIRENLEYSEDLTSNHYLADIAGLFFISCMIPEFKKSGEWLEFAKSELEAEIKKQVYEDGTDFEASTCYHRLALELFFYPALLARGNGIEFSAYYHEKLKKMFNVFINLIKPNGRMPQIGDNDSGQFFKLSPREVLDIRYLLALGGVFFKEPKWKVKDFFGTDGDITEIGLIYGEKGIKIWKSLSTNSLDRVGSKSFPDSGWYIMRDNLNYCIISCGPNGQNNYGGHCHNDKLSFELNIDGEDIIVDPGTYLYTSDPKSRNLFRSTAYHNTVVIDQKEQNRFVNRELFLLNDDAKARCLRWESDEKRDLFVGEHYGYKRLKYPVIHKRKIVHDKIKGIFRITDYFYGRAKHLFEWYFHFAPNIEVRLEKSKFIAAKLTSGIEVHLLPEVRDTTLQVDVFDGWVSSGYGQKRKAKVCKYRMEREADFEMVFKIEKN